MGKKVKDIIKKMGGVKLILKGNPINGGVGDKLKGADPYELALGINVEKEHIGKNKKLTHKEKLTIQADIAKDHLAEIPDYYTRLKAMEKAAKHED